MPCQRTSTNRFKTIVGRIYVGAALHQYLDQLGAIRRGIHGPVQRRRPGIVDGMQVQALRRLQQPSAQIDVPALRRPLPGASEHRPDTGGTDYVHAGECSRTCP